MGFEISCDDTCSGCTNGSALKTAIDALKDICVKIGEFERYFHLVLCTFDQSRLILKSKR